MNAASSEELKAAETARGAALYSFAFADADLASPLRACFGAYKATRPDRALSKLPRDFKPTTTLYVGKCGGKNGTVGARLHQHFGYGDWRTYSLNLSHWYPDEGLPLTLSVVRLPELPAGTVELLETTLWQSARPLLGQAGGR